MVRKRAYSETRSWPAKLQIYSRCLDDMAKLQDSGEAFYGECVYEDPLPTRKKSATLIAGAAYALVGSNYQQKPMRPCQYIPAQPGNLTITEEDSEKVLSAMMTETVISPEEAQLVSEAQSLGWSWSQIAKVLRGRTGKQLMRLCSQTPRPKRVANRKEPIPKDDNQVASKPISEQAWAPVSAPASMEYIDLESSTSSWADGKTALGLKQISEVEEVVNFTALNRSGGDDRVTFKKPISSMPPGFTGIEAHGLHSPEGMQYFEEVEVVDPDDRNRVFKFSLNDSTHCAYFNVGEGANGSPLMSWANLHCLYQLPNGTKWVEHGYLYDIEDLENYARKLGKDCKHLLPPDMHDQELVKKQGRYHSRVQNIEYECWIYPGALPKKHEHGEDAYFYRTTFKPTSLEKVE